MTLVRMGVSVVSPSEVTVAKEEGKLEYILQADGTWRAYLGDRMPVPVLEVTGPDKESIALHIQDLRDRLGLRDSYNIDIHHCRWFNEQRLFIALTTKSKNFRMGRRELGDVLLKVFENPNYSSYRDG